MNRTKSRRNVRRVVHRAERQALIGQAAAVLTVQAAPAGGRGRCSAGTSEPSGSTWPGTSVPR
jgi:hypothetical protein